MDGNEDHKKAMASFQEDFVSGACPERCATTFAQLMEYADALNAEVERLEKKARNQLGQLRHLNRGLRNQAEAMKKTQRVALEIAKSHQNSIIEARVEATIANWTAGPMGLPALADRMRNGEWRLQEGCEASPFSSRVCERGTKCCEVAHCTEEA